MQESESKKTPALAYITSSANEETKEAKAERPRFHSSSMKTRLPPFPNSWFHLAPFSEFKKDEIRSFKFLGHDIIAFKKGYTVLSPMFVFINSQDLDIWSTKSYCEKPIVLGDDGNIHLFRKWCKQFY